MGGDEFMINSIIAQPSKGDNTPYATAFKLLTLGFSVIPSGAGPDGKAPAVEWKKYQVTPPDEAELEKWENELHPKLWGIVTNDKVGVVEADTAQALSELRAELGEPNTLSPRGGGHWYINTEGHPFKTTAGILPGVDVRGVGGFINTSGSSRFGEYVIVRLPTPDSLIPWTKLSERVRAATNGRKPAEGRPITELKEGSRHADLISYIGKWRNRGFTQDEIETQTLALNRSSPNPLPEDEALKMAREYEHQTKAAHFNQSDYGNAERLVSLYGDIIRYSTERKSWLVWTGEVWEWDLGSIRIAKLAKQTARNILREAADEQDDDDHKELIKHATATERQVRLDAMIKSAESEDGVAIKVAELDANQWLINVHNGTIDLRTGILKSHDRADLITEILPIDYEPDAHSTEWDTFLHRIFSEKTDLISYLQRALGYSITGDQSEQVFFFCYGNGWNGKSTLLNACRLVMGGYATQVPPTAFMVDKTKHGGPDEAIASLYNKRLVCSTELEDGQRLSVSLVKRMTGGEPIWCEHKFERGYNFQTTHKLWLSGNHEPIITDTTNSIWYRLKKVPFAVEIPEADRKKGYAEYLAKEHSQAILTWLVQGCVEWQKTGTLGEPEAVTQAVAEYRDQQDILHDFLTERCIFQKSATLEQKALYADYKQWAEENDTIAIGKLTFRTRIQEKGAIVSTGNRNVKIWRGVRLRTESDGDVTSVTSVTEKQQSLLHEASIEKTLVKMSNKSNTNNTFEAKELLLPDKPCSSCGVDEPGVLPDGTGYYCTVCGKDYEGGE